MSRGRLRAGRDIHYAPTNAEIVPLVEGKPGDFWPGTISAVRPDGLATVVVQRPDGVRFTTTAREGNRPGDFSFGAKPAARNPLILPSVGAQAHERRLDLYVNTATGSNENTGRSENDAWADMDFAILKVNAFEKAEAPIVLWVAGGLDQWTETFDIHLGPEAFLHVHGTDIVETVLASNVPQAGSDDTKIVTTHVLTLNELQTQTIRLVDAAGNIVDERDVLWNDTDTIYVSAPFTVDPLTAGHTFKVYNPAAIFDMATQTFPLAPPSTTKVQDHLLLARNLGGGVGDVSGAGLVLSNLTFRAPDGLFVTSFWGVSRSNLTCYGVKLDHVARTGFLRFISDETSQIGAGFDASGLFLEEALVPFELGLAPSRSAWRGWGLSLRSDVDDIGRWCSLRRFCGFLINNHGTIFVGSNAEWDLIGGGFFSDTTSVLDTSERAHVRISAPQSVLLTLIPFRIECSADKSFSQAAGAQSGAMLKISNAELIVTGRGFCAIAYGNSFSAGAQRNYSPGFLSIDSDVILTGVTGANPPSAAMVAVGGGILHYKGDPTVSGFPATQELIVARENEDVLGTIYDQADLADLTGDGDALPLEVNGDGRHGWIRRM